MKHLAVQIISNRLHVTALFGSQQISGSPDLQVPHGNLKSAAQIRILPDGSQSFFRHLFEHFVSAVHKKRIRRTIGSADPPCGLTAGVNPTNDGKLIRLVFPELTEERRKELAKDIKKKGEGAKVAVRNIRRDAMDHFKKVGKAEDISEDEIKDLEDGIQKLTDQYVAQIDKAVDAKSDEILTV